MAEIAKQAAEQRIRSFNHRYFATKYPGLKRKAVFAHLVDMVAADRRLHAKPLACHIHDPPLHMYLAFGVERAHSHLFIT